MWPGGLIECIYAIVCGDRGFVFSQDKLVQVAFSRDVDELWLAVCTPKSVFFFRSDSLKQGKTLEVPQ